MTTEAEIRTAAAQHVPPHLQAGVLSHILYGSPTGDFLKAVFDNDLGQAAIRADPISLAALPAIVRFLHCDAPSACWGRPELADAWRVDGGFVGIQNRSKAA